MTHNPAAASDIEILWNTRIPLQDGIELVATITKPKTSQPLPVIFTLTPYTTDQWWDMSVYWPAHGFIYAAVNSRGRGGSGGTFRAFFQELEDGPQVCEWLAARPWCDGQVAMLGGSYDGMNQWLTLKSSPPHLRTILPMTTGHVNDFPYRGGITRPDRLSWDAHTSGVDAHFAMLGDQAFWLSRFKEMYFNHLPFADFPDWTGIPAHFFNVITSNPPHSPAWDPLRFTPGDYRRFDVPILSIAGYFDPIVRSTFHFYQEYMQEASQAAQEKFFLVVGPWDHATATGWGEQKLEMNGMRLGPAARVDINQLMADWYSWVMKGAQQPEFLQNRFAYYVTGRDEWRFARSLSDVQVSRERFYLDSTNSQANSIFHSGYLRSELPDQSQPDRYVYDPLDTRPGELELQVAPQMPSPTDQRFCINTFGNGVFYHSPPFEQERVLTGIARLVVWIEMDVPDTDFEAKIYEIQADGAQIELAACVLRARYRHGLECEDLVRPGEVTCLEMTGFNFISRQVGPGSRIRLFLHSPNSIYLQKNYNSGGVVANEGEQDALTAHIQLFHDEYHPSFLELPFEILAESSQ